MKPDLARQPYRPTCKTRTVIRNPPRFRGKPTTPRYHPFGEPRDTLQVIDTDHGYTGQRADQSTGLMYYQARYYDPTLRRFTQPDTIIPNPHNPQDLNRYTYTRNNPIRYTDPSGHKACERDCQGNVGSPVPRNVATEPVYFFLWSGTGDRPDDPESRKRVVNRVLTIEETLIDRGYEANGTAVFPMIAPRGVFASYLELETCDAFDCSALASVQEGAHWLSDTVGSVEGVRILVAHSQAATYLSFMMVDDPTFADQFDGIVLLSPPALDGRSADGFARTDTRMNGQSALDFVAYLEFGEPGRLRDPGSLSTDAISVYSYSGCHRCSFESGSIEFEALITQMVEIANG